MKSWFFRLIPWYFGTVRHYAYPRQLDIGYGAYAVRQDSKERLWVTSDIVSGKLDVRKAASELPDALAYVGAHKEIEDPFELEADDNESLTRYLQRCPPIRHFKMPGKTQTGRTHGSSTTKH